MNQTTTDSIIDNLFYVLPIIRKKLLKIEPQEVSPNFTISRLNIAIMAILGSQNRLPISEIAKKLLMPKPQMTRLINQMVQAGVVDRQTNPQDKRVIHITLTPQGIVTLDRCEQILKNNARKQLAFLSARELEELSQILIRLKEIGTSLENRGRS